jgi:hypothetical protein
MRLESDHTIGKLAASLHTLDCRHNQITHLENLPASLHTLECCWNRITRLEKLPASLHTLHCDWNHITRLEKLPASLHTLHCRQNQITRLENLPATLVELFFDCETIQYVDGLDWIYFSRITKFLSTYQLIRRYQIRWRLSRKWRRERAAKRIQKALEPWLWKPLCNDGQMGINVRLGWALCSELNLSKNTNPSPR